MARPTARSTVSGRHSLRLDVDPSPQVLQTDGRRLHAVPASLMLAPEYRQQGPFAPAALPAFPATTDPSATLSPPLHFPARPVIEAGLLRRFRDGARRASPVAFARPCRRAAATTPPEESVDGRSAPILLPSRMSQALGSRVRYFGATSAFTRVAARRLAHRPRRLCRWASVVRSPSLPPSKLRGFGLLPRQAYCFLLNAPAFAGRTGHVADFASPAKSATCPLTGSMLQDGEPSPLSCCRPCAQGVG